MKKWCIEYWDDRTGNNSLEKFCDNTLIFLLAAGDKKSQGRDIRIARLRLKQVIER